MLKVCGPITYGFVQRNGDFGIRRKVHIFLIAPMIQIGLQAKCGELLESILCLYLLLNRNISWNKNCQGCLKLEPLIKGIATLAIWQFFKKCFVP